MEWGKPIISLLTDFSTDLQLILSLRGEQTDARACGDGLLPDAKKGRNLAGSGWRSEGLSPSNGYSWSGEGVGKVVHQSGSVADVFAGQRSAVLRRFGDEEI